MALLSFRENWLRDLDDLISEKLDSTETSIPILAADMSLSEAQFYRRIKNWTGTTPNLYLRDKRLQKAKELIEVGKVKKVKDLAHQVGYLKVEYFSKLYYERYGKRPSDLIHSKYDRIGGEE